MSEPLRVALVGFGNHVRKNIARLFEGQEAYCFGPLVVRDLAGYSERWPDMASRMTDDYAAVLADPAIDVVYIATPIATHVQIAHAALDAGKHVWCEKPLTTSAADTEALVAHAARADRMLGEIAVYRHHAQFAQLQAILAEKLAAGVRLVSARARFTIPELAASDIRYNAALGGGALLDVGYYPVSAAVALFGPPRAVAASGYQCPLRGVDLSGTAHLDYGDFACQCLWGIGAAYGNELELNFSESTYLAPRAFSKPPELATRIAVTQANGSPGEPIEVPADDQFGNIFAAYAAAIRTGDRAQWARLGEQALDGARTTAAVRAALAAT